MHAKSYSASSHNDIVSSVGRSLQDGDKRLCLPMGRNGGWQNRHIPIKEVHFMNLAAYICLNYIRKQQQPRRNMGLRTRGDFITWNQCI